MKLITLIVLYLSTTQCGFGPGDQDHGYVTVREGAHMFWWLYHTTANVTNSYERPLILWLIGGPGGSSCGTGNFLLVGPTDENLNERETTWVKDFNILFVDSPVGSGYSYVDNLRYLNDNNTESAQDLLEVVRAFYEKLPQFKTTPFYVFGFGYGAKIGAEFIRLLYDEVQSGRIESNVKAVSSSASWISPIDEVLAIPSYLYQVSLIDENGKLIIENHISYMKELLDNGKYYQTTLEWYNMLNIIFAVTDGIDFGNIVHKYTRTSLDFHILSKDNIFQNYNLNKIDTKNEVDLNLLMNGKVKEALEIPNHVQWLSLSNDVSYNLIEDFMRSSTAIIESILNDTNIEVHINNGNLDVIASTPGQLRWINNLKWRYEEDFKNAPRITTWVNGIMEGYVKKGGQLSFYWINVSGQNTVEENVNGTREFLKSMTGF